MKLNVQPIIDWRLNDGDGTAGEFLNERLVELGMLKK